MKRISHRSSSGIILAIAITIVILLPSELFSEQVSYSSASYVVAGILVIDIGSSVANAVSLAADRPNRRNGYFGVAAGIISYGLVAAGYAMTDDDDLRDDFAIVMGGAGTASLVFGVLNMTRAGHDTDDAPGISRIEVFPVICPDGRKSTYSGINFKMVF
ncbi:MAG: hypothetical protein JW814_09200 [Candidatus Krumholzibacteriota bacterium]|nr:hypothetical protein [Candidatus Krumholzibacteriota bacterium]